jgi:hypothetical protein
MNVRSVVTLFVVLMTLSACFTRPLAGVPRLHPNHPDLYIFNFRYLDFIDSYGPGVGHVRERVKRALREERSYPEIEAIWEEAVAIAAERYLTTNSLIPPECTQGIEVISSGGAEGGGGAVTFRCKQ